MTKKYERISFLCDYFLEHLKNDERVSLEPIESNIKFIQYFKELAEKEILKPQKTAKLNDNISSLSYTKILEAGKHAALCPHCGSIITYTEAKKEYRCPKCGGRITNKID